MVMKCSFSGLTLCGVFLISAMPSWAQETPPPPVPQVAPVQPQLPGGGVPGIGGVVPGTGGPLLSKGGVKKLELTKEQTAKYDQLNAEFQKKQKELQFPGIDTLKSPDPSKLKEFLEAKQKLRPSYLAKVENLLTAEQKKIFEEVRREAPTGGPGFGPGIIGGPGFPPPLPYASPFERPGKFLSPHLQKRLKLSDEQKAKIDALQKDLEASVLKLLTDDQKKMLDDLKNPRLPGIGFPNIVPPQPGIAPIPPPGFGDPGLQDQLKKLIQEIESLRKEVKDLKASKK